MGDRVFIFMPSDKQERAYKLANAILRSLSYHARMVLKLPLSTNREQRRFEWPSTVSDDAPRRFHGPPWKNHLWSYKQPSDDVTLEM